MVLLWGMRETSWTEAEYFRRNDGVLTLVREHFREKNPEFQVGINHVRVILSPGEIQHIDIYHDQAIVAVYHPGRVGEARGLIPLLQRRYHTKFSLIKVGDF